MTKPSEELLKRIKEDYSAEEAGKTQVREVAAKKAEFVNGLVEYFSTPEIIELLSRRPMKIPLLVRYNSSMGAAMTGSPPDYELYISEEGLCIKRQDILSKRCSYPPKYEEWYEAIPYGGLFHDSSDGEDLTYAPSLSETIRQIEARIKDRL